MNRKFTLICMAPLLLGFNAAWADDGLLLPDPAADEARENAQIPAAAAAGLEIAAGKTAALPAEATIRLMNNADDDDAHSVTHDVQLPIDSAAAEGLRGLDTATSAFSAADDARDYGDEIAANGAENIENRGRADLPVDVPVPGRPDTLPTP